MPRNALVSIIITAKDLTSNAFGKIKVGLKGIGTSLIRFRKLSSIAFSKFQSGLKGISASLKKFKKSASGAFGKVQGGLKGLGSSLISFKTLAGGIATGVLVRLTKGLFDLGAQAEETETKFRTVFGESTKFVQEFNDTFGKIAGLSRTQAKELTASTATIVRGMGATQEGSAKAAIEIVRLGADLTSFNNLTGGTEIAVRRINAALGGEFEGLKRLGIVLRAGDVDRRALINTGKDAITQLTEQERVTARFQLITEKANVAVGDLERTQKSMANQARILGGQLTTVKEDMGILFLESFKLGTGFSDIIDSAENFTKVLSENRDQIVAWAAAAISLVTTLGSAFKTGFVVIKNVVETIGGTIGDLIELATSGFVGLGQVIKAGLTGNFQDIRDIAAIMEEEVADTMESLKKRVVKNFEDIGDQAENLRKNIIRTTDAITRAVRESQGIDTGIGAQIGRGEVPGGGVFEPDESEANARIARLEALALAIDAANEKTGFLVAKFDLGVITASEFSREAAVLTAELTSLAANADLADVQLIAVSSSLQDLAEKSQELNIDVPFKNLRFQVSLLREQLENNNITTREFASRIQALVPDMLAFRDSGKLSAEQLNQLQIIVNNLSEDADNIFGITRSTLLPGLAEDLTLAQAFRLELLSIFGDVESSGAILARIGSTFLSDFTGSITKAFAAFTSGSESAAKAFKNGMLNAIASVAAAKAKLYLGQAAAAVAEGLRGSPGAFAAAAKFVLAASIMAALAGSIGGLAQGGGSSAGTPDKQAERVEEKKGAAEIVILGGLLDMSDPRQADALADAINDLEGRRVTVRGGS